MVWLIMAKGVKSTRDWTMCADYFVFSLCPLVSMVVTVVPADITLESYSGCEIWVPSLDHLQHYHRGIITGPSMCMVWLIMAKGVKSTWDWTMCADDNYLDFRSCWLQKRLVCMKCTYIGLHDKRKALNQSLKVKSQDCKVKLKSYFKRPWRGVYPRVG